MSKIILVFRSNYKLDIIEKKLERNLIAFSRTFIIFVRGYASRTISSFPLSTVSIYSRFLSVSVEYRNLSPDRFERRNKAARNRFSSSVPLEWLRHRSEETKYRFRSPFPIHESLFCLYPWKNFEIIKRYREWIHIGWLRDP